MSTPSLSIVTVCLNAGSSIRACLGSVAAQSNSEYEHIVVDGGSSDETCAILRDAPAGRLVWSSEPDSGIADAMNKGVARASGEWILFLNADDRLANSESIATMLRAAKHASNADIISFAVEKESSNGLRTRFPNTGWTLKTAFKTTVPHQGALLRRHLFGKLGLHDTSFRIAMDYEWLLRAYWRKVRLERSDEVVSVMSDGGISSQLDSHALRRRFAEERRAHAKNAPTAIWRMLYRLYWILYPQFGVWKHSRR